MVKKFHKGRSKGKISKNSGQSNTEGTLSHKSSLVMPSSKLSKNEQLDTSHDGGCKETLEDDDSPENPKKRLKSDSSSIADIKMNYDSESSVDNENLLDSPISVKMCDNSSLELTQKVKNDSNSMSEIKINYDSESSIDNEKLLESPKNVKMCDSNSLVCTKKNLKDSSICKIKVNYDSESSVDNETLSNSNVKFGNRDSLELTKIRMKNNSNVISTIKLNYDSVSSEENENVLIENSGCAKMCNSDSLELSDKRKDSSIMSKIKDNYECESSIVRENILFESSNSIKMCGIKSLELPKEIKQVDLSGVTDITKSSCDKEIISDNVAPILDSSDCPFSLKVKMEECLDELKENEILLSSEPCDPDKSNKSNELYHIMHSFNLPVVDELDIQFQEDVVTSDTISCFVTSDKNENTSDLTQLTDNSNSDASDIESPVFEKWPPPCSSNNNENQFDMLQNKNSTHSHDIYQKIIECDDIFLTVDLPNQCNEDKLDNECDKNNKLSDDVNSSVSPKMEGIIFDKTVVIRTSCDPSSSAEIKDSDSKLTEDTNYSRSPKKEEAISNVAIVNKTCHDLKNLAKMEDRDSNSSDDANCSSSPKKEDAICSITMVNKTSCDLESSAEIEDSDSNSSDDAICSLSPKKEETISDFTMVSKSSCDIESFAEINDSDSNSSDDVNCSISPKKEKAISDVIIANKTYCVPKNFTELKDSELFPSSVHCDPSTSPDIDESKPPLVMQSSNLPTQDGLDIGHDGGGFETSEDDFFSEPPEKRMKIGSSSMADIKLNYDSDSSMDNDNFLYSNDQMEQSLDLDNDKCSDTTLSNQSRVMEFDILDEFESNDNDEIERDSDEESDISLDELDAMLEAGLENGKYTENASSNIEDFEHEEKEKVILKVRGRDHFDVLPEGWIEVTHNSGMPIYLHKATRVCSVSKPYFLGPGSTRKHEIPISAIPCLHYLKELEKEKFKEATENREGHETFPPAKVESVKDTKESGSLNYLAVREYCQKRFEFQTITVKRFKTWSGRRKHQKQLKQKQRPTLPDNTKLITCPLPPASNKTVTNGSNTKREFIMNPSGKSPVCILHEYVQHTLRVQPKYIFKELENASTPYGAVVIISGIEYGSGYGSSKKQAKSEAAKSALDVLIPKMKMFAPEGLSGEEQQDVEFFDQVRVEDPRVCELSVKAGQPHPYQILLECLKRNYGMGDTEIDFRMRNLKHQKNEFIMTVGKHTASVICKNKRDGKHRASQAILQMLHPHISSWGSLLRMYGKGSVRTLKEKKEAEQRITELQSQACANKPNMSILNKLKEEMLKYRERMKLKKPIGKLIPEQMNLSTSDSNLKNVEL